MAKLRAALEDTVTKQHFNPNWRATAASPDYKPGAQPSAKPKSGAVRWSIRLLPLVRMNVYRFRVRGNVWDTQAYQLFANNATFPERAMDRVPWGDFLARVRIDRYPNSTFTSRVAGGAYFTTQLVVMYALLSIGGPWRRHAKNGTSVPPNVSTAIPTLRLPRGWRIRGWRIRHDAVGRDVCASLNRRAVAQTCQKRHVCATRVRDDTDHMYG